MDIDEYADRHPQFAASELPPLLARVARPGVIVDLGCGDGAVLWGLRGAGRLGEVSYAVDLAEAHVRSAEALVPGIRGVVADATNVDGMEDGSADGAIASQLIEHLPDDRALVSEIARLVRPGGWWYIGSILRGRRAWWIYSVDGERRLDPTHVREYRSEEQFRKVLDHPDLEIQQLLVSPVRFPVSDLILRLIGRTGLVSRRRLALVYTRSRTLAAARRLRVRVPGYSLIECAGVRRTS